MSLYKPANILFLKGLHLSDLTEDDEMFDKRFEEPAASIYTDEVVKEMISSPCGTDKLNSIPSKFTTVEEWPETTNLLCWNCSLSFETIPWFIPTYFKSNGVGDIEVGVCGNYCSENCAQSWINCNYEKHSQERDDKTKFLKMIYKIFTNQTILIIMPAENKTLMKQYCGESGITEEEYQKKNKMLANAYTVSTCGTQLRSPKVNIAAGK